MKPDDVNRLKELEVENAKLKRIVADQTLHIAALTEVSKGNWWARRVGGRRSWCSRTASAYRSGGRCRYVGQHRSTQRHEADIAPYDQALRA
jgi:hypothetical protein